MNGKIGIMNISNLSQMNLIARERIDVYPRRIDHSQALNVAKLWLLHDSVSGIRLKIW